MNTGDLISIIVAVVAGAVSAGAAEAVWSRARSAMRAVKGATVVSIRVGDDEMRVDYDPADPDSAVEIARVLGRISFADRFADRAVGGDAPPA